MLQNLIFSYRFWIAPIDQIIIFIIFLLIDINKKNYEVTVEKKFGSIFFTVFGKLIVVHSASFCVNTLKNKAENDPAL